VKTPVAVLISGHGSNLQALIDACAQSDYPARIALVISNKDNAYGLARAKDAGIPTQIIRHSDYPSRELFDAALHAALQESGVELVCLAGFMRVLTADFVRQWEGKMINIHPSLLPSFKGMKTHEVALATGVKIHGCSVHYVTAEMDSGPLIVQAAVLVHEGDTPESLGKRVLTVEHIIYPLALAKLCSPVSVRPLSDAQKDAVLINY
jgi:phosphoribosylglycinamide formyltransferase-1